MVMFPQPQRVRRTVHFGTPSRAFSVCEESVDCSLVRDGVFGTSRKGHNDSRVQEDSGGGETAEGKTGKPEGPVNPFSPESPHDQLGLVGSESPENVPPFYSKAARVAFEKLPGSGQRRRNNFVTQLQYVCSA
jgi:hypothetical protein